jgi:hypothetical protein
MRSRYWRLISSGALALSLAVMTSLTQAAPNPLPPNSNAFGIGYDQAAAEWVEWTVAIPAASNPLFDSDGAFAAIGQLGKVWFLTGTTGQGVTPPVTRTVTVPTGTALFFPIVNYFWVNTPEYGDPPWSPAQEANVRQNVLKPVVDSAYGLILEIDGRAVPNIDKLRVSGAVGECTIPDDNIFGVPFAPGPHPCVADGYWVLLPPLSAGNHTIHFGGGFTFPSVFSLDVTYHITVRGR